MDWAVWNYTHTIGGGTPVKVAEFIFKDDAEDFADLMTGKYHCNFVVEAIR